MTFVTAVPTGPNASAPALRLKHFKAIAAMSENRVIGHGNKIPWHLPEDFKWFKQTTVGHAVVMGRRTFESLGKPLPNRHNVVLTRSPEALRRRDPERYGAARVPETDPSKPGMIPLPKPGTSGAEATWLWLISSLDQLNPELLPMDVFIGGGAQVYAQALPRCSDLFLTLVKRVVEGDAFFPAFEHGFVLTEEIRDCAEFKILHYRNRSLSPDAPCA